MTKPKREKLQKEKEQREGRTYHLSVRMERIAHDIRVTEQDTLLSKAIQAICIDCLRKRGRIDRLTSNRSPLLQFPTLEVMTNKKEGIGEKEIEHIPEQ